MDTSGQRPQRWPWIRPSEEDLVPGGLLSAKQAAAIVGCSARRLRVRRVEGKRPFAVVVGTEERYSVRWPLRELQAWMKGEPTPLAVPDGWDDAAREYAEETAARRKRKRAEAGSEEAAAE